MGSKCKFCFHVDSVNVSKSESVDVTATRIQHDGLGPTIGFLLFELKILLHINTAVLILRLSLSLNYVYSYFMWSPVLKPKKPNGLKIYEYNIYFSPSLLSVHCHLPWEALFKVLESLGRVLSRPKFPNWF